MALTPPNQPIAGIPVTQQGPSAPTTGQIEQLRQWVKALQQEKQQPKFYTWGNALGDVTKDLMGAWAGNQANQLERQRIAAGAPLGQEGIVGTQSGAAGGGAASSPPFSRATSPKDGTGSTDRQVASLEETPDISERAMRLSTQGETNKRGKAALFNISKDTAGSLSYGPFGLNSKTGSAAQFAKEHPELGLTAEPGSPEFNDQWGKASATKYDDMKKAHEDWHKKNIMGGLTEDMTRAGIDSKIAEDPRVQIYMADRKLQMGKAGLNQALRYAGNANSPEDFIHMVSEVDRQRLPYNFRSYLKDNPNNIKGLNNRINLRRDAALGTESEPVRAGVGPDALAMADPEGTSRIVNAAFRNGNGQTAGQPPIQVAQNAPQFQNPPLSTGRLQEEYGQLVRNLMMRGGMTMEEAIPAAQNLMKMRTGTMPTYETGTYGQIIEHVPGRPDRVVGMQPGFPGVVKPSTVTGTDVLEKYDPNTGGISQTVIMPQFPKTQQPTQAPAPSGRTAPTSPQTSPQGATVQAPTQPAPAPKTTPQAPTGAPTGGPLVTAPPATPAPSIAAKPGQQLAMADLAGVDPFAELAKGVKDSSGIDALKSGSKLQRFAQEKPPIYDLQKPATDEERGAAEALAEADANPPKQLMMRNALSEAYKIVNDPNSSDTEKIDALKNVDPTRKASQAALEDKMKAQDKGFSELQKSFRDAETQSNKLSPELKFAKRLLKSPDFNAGPASQLVTTVQGLREQAESLFNRWADDAKKQHEAHVKDPNQPDADPRMWGGLADWVKNNHSATTNQVYTKILSGSILQSLRGMLGPNAGQFRVQELRMLEQAFGNPNLTLGANKTVMDMIDKINDRNILIGKMASTYAHKHGGLDASFEDSLSNFEAKHPVFNDEELAKLGNIVTTGRTPEEAPSQTPAGGAPQPATGGQTAPPAIKLRPGFRLE